jgi:GAF domain-containing protein
VIHESFNYYHVGIFLNDDRQVYTVLTASNSKIGGQLLANGYQIKVNQTGFISSVARTGILRLSQDRRQDPDSFEVSNFPETFSEAAIPMKAEDAILGVLDLHSNQANAFDSTAVDILSILADQIAIAIQNARAYIETQAAIAESQVLYGAAIKQAWQTTVRPSSTIGYRFTGTTPVPLEKPIMTREIKAALDRGEAITTNPEDQSNGGGHTLAMPLKLRGETIGVIHVKMPADAELGDDEADIVRAAADRVALSLENSTLIEESQRRALREQTIGQISARIGAGTEIETILKTAVRELGNQIGGAQISIEIGRENE